MAEKVYLCVDLGAESGRVMAGRWEGRTISLEEIQNGLALARKKHGGRIVSVVPTGGQGPALAFIG